MKFGVIPGGGSTAPSHWDIVCTVHDRMCLVIVVESTRSEDYLGPERSLGKESWYKHEWDSSCMINSLSSERLRIISWTGFEKGYTSSGNNIIRCWRFMQLRMNS